LLLALLAAGLPLAEHRACLALVLAAEVAARGLEVGLLVLVARLLDILAEARAALVE
jgi:hypothetical protein